jgi:outer membrane protein assembly factor BamB
MKGVNKPWRPDAPARVSVAGASGFLFLIAAAAVGGERGADWPGWRGPTGMGQTDARDLPLTWGGKEMANVRWKAPLLPAGAPRPDQNQSSPIVVAGRVIVTVSWWPAGVPTSNYPEHHVLCFRVDDGQRLWDTQVPPGPWLLKDLRGGYTAPTPASDGRRVYVLFGSAVLAGLDLDGKLLWRQEIVPHQFDVAIGTSPVVYRDVVLVAADQLGRASALLAFDGKTGALKWRKDRPGIDWDHSTPVLASIKGRLQLLAATANALQGLDPDTGDVLWSCRSADRIGDTVSPVLAGGVVYCDSGRGGPGIAVDPTGRGDVTKTHFKWKVNRVPEGFSSPVAAGDFLYRIHSPGVVQCWRLATGVPVFRERLEGAEPAASPIATADGRVYFASASKTYVLKAGPTPQVLARNDLGDPSRASPAVAGGRLFLKGRRYLYCIGKK